MVLLTESYEGQDIIRDIAKLLLMSHMQLFQIASVACEKNISQTPLHK